jgi:hypothetical protein
MLDDRNLTVTVLAISTNQVKPEATSIILVTPDGGASLWGMPRGYLVVNSTLEIIALPSTSESTHPYLEAGDYVRITETGHPLVNGEWRLFLIYEPTMYPMYGNAWNISVDSQGHSQLTLLGQGGLPSDPMRYYGFLGPPSSDAAALMAVLLIACVAVIGSFAWTRTRRNKN